MANKKENAFNEIVKDDFAGLRQMLQQRRG